MKNTRTFSSFLIALAASSSVLAQAPVAPPNFAALDKNKDGRVSGKEAEPRGDLHDAFDSLDQNHDGFLTATEFAAWGGTGTPKGTTPIDPTTGPGGSNGAQHMPKN